MIFVLPKREGSSTQCQVTGNREPNNFNFSLYTSTIDFFRHPLIYSLDFCKKNVLYKRAKKNGSGLYWKLYFTAGNFNFYFPSFYGDFLLTGVSPAGRCFAKSPKIPRIGSVYIPVFTYCSEYLNGTL